MLRTTRKMKRRCVSAWALSRRRCAFPLRAALPRQITLFFTYDTTQSCHFYIRHFVHPFVLLHHPRHPWFTTTCPRHCAQLRQSPRRRRRRRRCCARSAPPAPARPPPLLSSTHRGPGSFAQLRDFQQKSPAASSPRQTAARSMAGCPPETAGSTAAGESPTATTL